METASNTNGHAPKRDHTTRKLCVNAINLRPDRDFGYEDLCLALGEQLDERSVMVKLARAAADGEIQRTGKQRYAALSFVLPNRPPAPRLLRTQPVRPAAEPSTAPNSALALLLAKRSELREELAGIETAIKALGGR